MTESTITPPWREMGSIIARKPILLRWKEPHDNNGTVFETTVGVVNYDFPDGGIWVTLPFSREAHRKDEFDAWAELPGAAP